MAGLRAVPRRGWVGRLVGLGAMAALASGLAGVSSVGRAQAGLLSPWTVTAAPTTLTQYQPTSIVLTVTALPPTTIGCVRVTIPAGFTVSGWSAPSPWIAQLFSSGPPAVVQFNVTSSPQAIANGASVKLTTVATPTATLLGAWSASSNSQGDCSSSSANGPAISLAAFVIVPAPSPTPTPTLPAPTPTPTPTPMTTPTPSGVPTPTLTLPPIPDVTIPPVPSPLPGSGPTPTPLPTTPAHPAASPGASAPEPVPPNGSNPAVGTAASATPSVGPVAIATAPADGSGGGAPGGGDGLTVARPATAGSIPVLDLPPFRVLGSFVWIVPGFFLGLPGLIMLLVVAVQALGAGAFVPITRRVLRAPPAERPPRDHPGG